MTIPRQSGMTLVELMVAMVVTVMVTASAVSILRGVSATRQRTDAQVSLQQESRSAADALVSALQNACRTDDQVLEGTHLQQGDLPADRIRFFSTSRRQVRAGQPEGDLREREFFLAQGDANELPVLVCRTDPERNEAPHYGGVIERLAGNVLSMEVGYFDGTQWLPEWPLSQKGWPVAIRFRLVLAADARTEQLWSVSRLVHFPCMPSSDSAMTAGSTQDANASPQVIPPAQATPAAGGGGGSTGGGAGGGSGGGQSTGGAFGGAGR